MGPEIPIAAADQNFAWICKQHQDLIGSVLIFRTKIIWSGPEFGLVRCGYLNAAIVHCLRILIYCYNFRSACLFWSKQATNILKTTKILLLMVQFHNTPSNFANLASWGDRHWLSEPTTCFRIIGKEICFHKIGPITMPKRIGYKISTIFFICKMTKTSIADLMKCASKIYF